MNLDAQHDRSALTLATVPDETHTEPETRTQAASTVPAADAATEAPPTPTNTFEAFGSFS